MNLNTELMLLWSALLLYVCAGCVAIAGTLLRRRLADLVLALGAIGLAAHTASIGYRWIRLEHGPFLTLFEILSSNIWSLTLVFTLCYWRLPVIRPIAAFVMPILFMMMAWLLLASPGESNFPATYDTAWLYIHIGFGKIFLGAVLIAVGLSGAILARRLSGNAGLFPRLPDSASLSELAFRFMALGLVFDSLMLVAGAIWAQDAWGRYWDWDPLETWAFITWLIVALSLHIRVTWNIRPTTGAVLIITVFAVAFLTFFGVPFISSAPHQGAV